MPLLDMASDHFESHWRVLELLDRLRELDAPEYCNRATIIDCWKDDTFAMIVSRSTARIPDIQPVGFVAWGNENNPEVFLLWVDPAHRGTGLSHRLLRNVPSGVWNVQAMGQKAAAFWTHIGAVPHQRRNDGGRITHQWTRTQAALHAAMGVE